MDEEDYIEIGIHNERISELQDELNDVADELARLRAIEAAAREYVALMDTPGSSGRAQALRELKERL